MTSFRKEPDALFPDQERRHYQRHDGAAPRAARATLGPGLVPAEEEPDAWGHHVSRTHTAHRGDAALPSGWRQGLVPAEGTPRSHPPDPRWQSSYQAQTSGAFDDGDGVGKPTRRKGKKILAASTSNPASPFAHVGRSVLRQESEVAIHDGTVKNSAHVPGYSGHISAANPQTSALVTERITHDKSLFAENYASQMKAFGGV